MRRPGRVVAAGVGAEQRQVGREVGRGGRAGHHRVALLVHGDALAEVVVAAANVGRVNPRRPRRVHLRHKGIVAAAAVTRLVHAGSGRE
jgi:hypothetical protein